MGGLIEAASGVLDRRLLVSTFLPVLAFLSALVVLTASGVGWTATARWWSTLSAEVRVLLLLALLLLALLLTQLLAALRVPLIRLYEGYWEGLPGGRRLADRLRRHHIAVQETLPEDDPRWLVYPASPEHVMPTTLGNVLRGAEEHSADRYDIDAVTAWPRLYPTLPESFRLTFAKSADDLDLLVTISALGGVFALGGLGFGAFLLPWYGTLLAFSGGCLTAWLGYRGSIRSAESYGQLFRTAFDVYRGCLLDAMGMPRPTDIGAEKAQWRALDQLWIRGAMSSPNADTAPPPEPLDEQDTAPLTGQGTTSAPPRRKLRPAFVCLAAAAFLTCLTLAVDEARGPGPARATRDLGAYHQLLTTDVRGENASRLSQRYTLRPVSKNDPIRPADLGPRLTPDALRDKKIIPLPPPWSSVPAPALRIGTPIVLELLPTKKNTLLTLPDVLLLDATGPRGEKGIVVALSPTDADALLERLSTGGRYAVTVPS